MARALWRNTSQDVLRLQILLLGASPCAAGLAGPDDAGSNAEVQYPDAGGTFTMLAKRHIAKGEEVTVCRDLTTISGCSRAQQSPLPAARLWRRTSDEGCRTAGTRQQARGPCSCSCCRLTNTALLLGPSVLTHPVAQVTNNYGTGYLHRPDMAMLVYGFVPGREPPVMSTCDLPDGFGDVRHPQQAYPVTPTLEPDYGEWVQAAVWSGLRHVPAALLRCCAAQHGVQVGLQRPATCVEPAVLQLRRDAECTVQRCCGSQERVMTGSYIKSKSRWARISTIDLR